MPYREAGAEPQIQNQTPGKVVTLAAPAGSASSGGGPGPGSFGVANRPFGGSEALGGVGRGGSALPVRKVDPAFQRGPWLKC